MKLSDRKTAIIVGILILVAYGVLLSEATDSRSVIMIADVISGLAVIGIAVLLFPYLKSYSKGISYTYLAARLIEGGLMVYAGIAQMSSSLEHHKEFIYAWPHMIAFIVGGFAFYYLLYISKLVPRFLSIWGVVAIAVLLMQTVLKFLEIDTSSIEFLLILIITNEVVLAFWLMIKGFDLNGPEEKIESEPLSELR